MTIDEFRSLLTRLSNGNDTQVMVRPDSRGGSLSEPLVYALYRDGKYYIVISKEKP